MQILEQTLSKGLYKILALELEHSPKAEELNFSVAAVLEVLERNGLTDRDASRLEEALVRCSGDLNRWPTPAQIIKRLPKRSWTSWYVAGNLIVTRLKTCTDAVQRRRRITSVETICLTPDNSRCDRSSTRHAK